MRKDAYSVEVIGFNQTERIVLSSIFGLSARRTPKFTQHTTVAYSPDLFLVDAAEPQAVALFKERNQSGKVAAIMIGETDHGTGWPVLGRPLQWTRLFKAFDLGVAESLANQAANEAAAPAPAYTPAPASTTASQTPQSTSPIPQPAASVPPATVSPLSQFASPPVPHSSTSYAPTEPMYSVPPMRETQPTSYVPNPSPAPAQPAFPPPVPTLPSMRTIPPMERIERSIPPVSRTVPPVNIPAATIPPRIAPPPPRHAPQPPVITTVVPPTPANNADWVLVVDDNLTVREFMRTKLAPFNFNVDYAESGEQAIGLTGSRHYTCVFLDVIMPGIDGYQVCKLIKSKKSLHKTAVVMLTSKGSPFDKIRGAMAGCDAYLTKPVDEDKLLGTIVKFLPMHA
jgi:CheY-like chemotaxis protein